MRLFFKILLGLVFLIAIIVIIPFTQFGNNLIKPYIQDALNKYSPIPLEVALFRLGFSSFEVNVKGGESINAHLQGSYSLLKLSIDSYLKLDVKDLSYAAKALNAELQGSFVADIKAAGDLSSMQIVGESNIAHSKTIFLAQLKDLAFSSLDVQVQDASVQSLLGIIAKPPYAQGLINITTAIVQDTQGINGKADFVLSNGSIDASLVQKDFNIAIPSTIFNIQLLANFNGENVAHNLLVKSNVGNITTEGTTNINTLATDSQYALNINNLAPLTPLVQMPIRGDLNTDGYVKGDQKSLLIDGKSNIAQSDTLYRIQLANFAPSSVEANIKSLSLEKIQYMLYQPIYTNGTLNSTIRLNDFDAGISGQIIASILNGTVNNAAMKNNFDINIPTTAYKLNISSTLHRGSGELVADISSALVNIVLDKTNFTLNPIALHGPYILNIPELNRLQFVTGMPMKGKIDANGNIDLNNAHGLQASFISNMLGGSVNAHLNNNTINAQLSKLRSEEFLKMLTYAPFFSSEMNGQFQYELLSNRGILEASLSNGHLSKSPLTALLLPAFGVDLSKEIYQQASLKSVIANKVINSDINLLSHNTSITAKNAKINTSNNNVDAILTIAIKNKPTNVTIAGNIKQPKISIDRLNQAVDKLKDKVGEKINEKIEKTLDKNLQKHLTPEQTEDVKGILQNIFKK